VFTKTSSDTFKNSIFYDTQNKSRSFVESYEYERYDSLLSSHIINYNDWDGYSSKIFLNNQTNERFSLSGYPLFSPSRKYFIDYSDHSFPLGDDGISLIKYPELENIWNEESGDWFPDSIKWISDSLFSYYEANRDTSDFNIVSSRIKIIRNINGEKLN